MNKIDLGRAINTIANISVLAGLVFVGWQLQQDREIAENDVLLRGAEYTMMWADLVDQTSDVWLKGLAGEPLTPEEALRFDAIAQAWEFRLYSSFEAATRNSLVEPARFARQAALDLQENPGLRSWWDGFRSRMERVSLEQSDPWEESVYSALRELDAQ